MKDLVDVSQMPQQWRENYEWLCNMGQGSWFMPSDIRPSCKDGKWRIDCYRSDGEWDFAIVELVDGPPPEGWGPVWCESQIPKETK